MTETETCPDCDSTDVSYYRENTHPWYCWNCGIRFDHPHYTLVAEQ